MKANFQKALKAVLVHEGGWSNHKDDPGGATMQGVTQRVYDAFRAKSGAAKRSVKLMDKAERDTIYKEQYWDAVKGDQLPAGVDYVVFDGAVNSGPVRAIKWLQQSLKGYHGAIDGQIGLGTLQALSADDNNDALIDRMCDRRMAFLKALGTWSVFGAGWTKRVAGVRAMGKAMASGKTVTIPKATAQSASGSAKAPVADMSVPPSKAMGDAATGAGTAITTGSLGIQSTVTDTMDKLSPFAGYSGTVGTLLTYLAVVGAVLVAGGLLWRAYAVWKARKVAEAVG